MDALKAQLAKLQQQFAALNASQRMLVGTLVAVMALTLLYWSKYAGSPDMVPVLDSALTSDQIGRIDNALDSRGIKHSVVGGKVLVPADQKAEAVANLMYAEALPDDKTSAFEEMSKQLTIFSSPSDHEDNHVMALQETLDDVIRHMDGVRDATVIINAKNDRRIEDSIPPSASVFVTTRGGVDNPKMLARAIAKGVAGTVSGLKQENVVVTIDDRQYPTSDSTNGLSGDDDLMEIQQRSEARVADKIRTQLLGFIPNLHVAVTCDVENRTMTQHKVSYDKTGSLSMPTEEKSSSVDTTGGASNAGEPGVGANTSASIPTPTSVGASTGATSSTSDSTTDNQNAFGSTTDNIATPAGKDKVVSATVLIPRSYFVATYKISNDTKGKAPDEAVLQTFANAQLTDLKTKVMTSIGLTSSDALSMGMYTDVGSVDPASASIAPSSATLALVASHGKEIGLGVLAVVSLFMMSSMVRKSAVAPALTLAGETGTGTSPFGAGSLPRGADLLTEASASAATLDGVEMDEDSLRTQQLLEQVSSMVKQNPDNAAALVKRWMSRG